MVDLTRQDTMLIAYDENGNRVGESHPRAKLTDADVELIRELAEPTDGSPPMKQRLIAEKFEVAASTICEIVSFRKRASRAVGWRRVALVVRGRDVVDGSPAAGVVTAGNDA